MKKQIAILIMAALLLSGCAGVTPDALENLPVFDKIYYVVFEKQPEITDNRIFYGTNMEIGEIVSEKPGSGGLYVAKISVLHKYDDLMKDNVVFYVSDGKLLYDTFSNEGKQLNEGAKMLGFTGKASLTWFKTKHKVRSTSSAVIQKAQDMYQRAVGDGNVEEVTPVQP